MSGTAPVICPNAPLGHNGCCCYDVNISALLIIAVKKQQWITLTL